MNDEEMGSDLQPIIQRLRQFNVEYVPDARYKAHLRAELLRRHQELTVESTQRAAVELGSRFTGLRRLTLVAPPAFAVALVFTLIVWVLPIMGHQTSESTEAATVSSALARSAPTVTAVQFVVHETKNGATRSVPLQYSLKPRERLLIRYGHAYLWERTGWRLVPGYGQSNSTQFDWEWAFAVLPARLANRDVGRHSEFLRARTVDGQRAIGWRFSAARSGGVHIRWTLWINQRSGLAVQLRRLVQVGDRIAGRDVVDYQYERRG